MEHFIEFYNNYIKVREATKQGYAIATTGDSINLEQPNSKTRRGRVGKQIANTLTCSCNQGVVVKEEIDINKVIRIGQVSPEGSQAGMVYLDTGLFPTVCACTHGYAIGNILEIKNNEGDVYKMKCNKCGSYNLIEYDYLNVNPTLECECGNIIIDDSNKLFKLGNIYPSGGQNGNIYDSNGISPTISSGQGIKGNGIGSNNAPKIKINNKKGDSTYMWKNELEKFDFKMEEIKLFDAFAGKGALHKSLKKLGVPVKVVGLSEIEPDAIIAYAAVHINDFKNLDFNYPSDDEMRELLIDRNIGWDFIKQKSSIPRMKKEKLKLLYKATILTNNLGDISKLDYDNMFDFDLFNLSFCCQDISNAGKQKGLKNEDGTHTRSGLIKFGLDVVKAKKPKYIMIENVKALIQKKFINDFYSIINEIESYGYKCFYPTKEDKKGNISPTCLNAKDYGIPQNRERIFVICIRNDINLEFEFPKGFDKGIRLKDLLEDNIDEKYYLSEVYNERFKESLSNKDLQSKIPKSGEIEVIGTTQQPSAKGTNCRHWVHNPNKIIGALSATEYKQPKQIIDEKYFLKKTKDFFIKNSLDMEAKGNGFRFEPHVKENAEISKCVTTRAGARMDDNYIIYDTKSEKSKITFDSKNCLNNLENLKIRKLTPLCCWRLMGFDDEDFYHTKELGLSDSSLYKLAGNSIVVNCLYYIFKEVFKEYIIK